jgi:hypothetical protein
MLYAGLDLSRKCLDFHLLDAEGTTVEVGASPPDVDGLAGLTQRLTRHGEPIRAAIESSTLTQLTSFVSHWGCVGPNVFGRWAKSASPALL